MSLTARTGRRSADMLKDTSVIISWCFLKKDGREQEFSKINVHSVTVDPLPSFRTYFFIELS